MLEIRDGGLLGIEPCRCPITIIRKRKIVSAIERIVKDEGKNVRGRSQKMGIEE